MVLDIIPCIDKKIIFDIINVLETNNNNSYNITLELSYSSHNRITLNNLISYSFDDEQKNKFKNILEKKPLYFPKLPISCANFNELKDFLDLTSLFQTTSVDDEYYTLNFDKIRIVCFDKNKHYNINYELEINKTDIIINYKNKIIIDQLYDILSNCRTILKVNFS